MSGLFFFFFLLQGPWSFDVTDPDNKFSLATAAMIHKIIWKRRQRQCSWKSDMEKWRNETLRLVAQLVAWTKTLKLWNEKSKIKSEICDSALGSVKCFLGK